MKPQRVMIIGYSGSGKSTLAGICAAQYGLPVLYLDTLQFLPGWVVRDREEFRGLLAEFLKQDRWVIDGTYTKVFYERRLSEADEIIFMNFNRFACFFRAWKRYRTYRGKARESIAEGCHEKFDREFMMWILRNSRTKKHKENYRRVMTEYAEKVIVIRNQRELSRFFEERDL